MFNLPRLPSSHHPPTNNPVGQDFALSFPCVRVLSIIVVATFTSRRRSLSSSLFLKRVSVTVPKRGCPADHCALSREGASRRSPYTTAPHTFTYRRQANRPAEPLHSPTRSHPSSRTLLETYVTCRKLNSFVRAWSIGDSGWFRRVTCYHVTIRQISCPPSHDPAQAGDHCTDSMLRIGLLPGLHTPSLQCTSFTPNNEPKARYHMRFTAPESIANQPLALQRIENPGQSKWLWGMFTHWHTAQQWETFGESGYEAQSRFAELAS